MFTSTYYYAYCAHPQFSILKIKTDDCWSTERSDSHKTVERGSDHHHLERGWHFYGNTTRAARWEELKAPDTYSVSQLAGTR